MKNIGNQSWLGFCLYVLLGALLLSNHTHFYDDEIFNINILLNYPTLFEIIKYVQSVDVHPPLSYILNKLSYDLFGDFKYIIIFPILFSAFSLKYFYSFATRLLNTFHSQVFLFLATFVNTGIFLWTTSIRWYAYWVPLATFLLVYILKNRVIKKHNVVIIVTTLALMTYISYLTFILIIGLFVWHLLSRWNHISIQNILFGAISYTTMTAYQIFVFLTVHLAGKGSQTSGILNSALNGAYGIVNGGSLFVVEPLLVISSILSFGIIIWGTYTFNVNKTIKNRDIFFATFLFLLITFLLLALTGIGGKYRNNIFLSLPLYFVVALCFDKFKLLKFNLLYLLIIMISCSQGYYHLLQKTNTSKRSYNLPVNELIQYIEDDLDEKVVLTIDPSIHFALKSEGINVLDASDFNKLELMKNYILNLPYPCTIYLIKTYQGSLDNTLYNNYINLFSSLGIKTKEKFTFGYDKHYKVKNKLPGNKPKVLPYYIQIERSISNISSLP